MYLFFLVNNNKICYNKKENSKKERNYKMNKIYNNLSIDNLMKTEWFNQFDESQQREIKWGLEANLDVSVYAKPEFNGQQMSEIREGLEENLDVSVYDKKYLTWVQMFEIRTGLKENKINISICFAKIIYYLNKIKEKLSEKERN